MLHAGRVVGHDIPRPGNVIVPRAVVVVTLVQGLESEKVRGGSRRGGGSLLVPVHGGGVVVKADDGGFPAGDGVDDHVVVLDCG
jgi:hypothetical protein